MRLPPHPWQIRAMALDWQRIVFTEHMVEAAAVVAECHVALDFEGDETVAYEVRVYKTLKGDGDPYFAVGANRADADGFRPVGTGDTPEDALNACLAKAGVHHRRLVKQKS